MSLNVSLILASGLDLNRSEIGDVLAPFDGIARLR